MRQVWECGCQVFSPSFFSTGRDVYLFEVKTLLKISGTICISTDKGRLLNLFNHKLKMSQNLYFDLKSHLVTYFHLSVLHPNLKTSSGQDKLTVCKGTLCALSPKEIMRFMSIYGKSQSTCKSGLHEIKLCTTLFVHVLS